MILPPLAALIMCNSLSLSFRLKISLKKISQRYLVRNMKVEGGLV